MYKRVVEFEKCEVSSEGIVIGASGKTLTPWLGRGGYLKVCLSNERKRRWVYVHRLVCETFHGMPDKGKEVNHKDGNKFNNSASNLEWVTRSENGYHAFRNGLNRPAIGVNSSNAKLTDSDVVQIRRLRGLLTQVQIGKMFGINDRHVCNIQLNRFWKHVETPTKGVSHV